MVVLRYNSKESNLLPYWMLERQCSTRCHRTQRNLVLSRRDTNLVLAKCWWGRSLVLQLRNKLDGDSKRGRQVGRTRKGNCHCKIPDVFQILQSKDSLQLLNSSIVLGRYQQVHFLDDGIDAGNAVLRSQSLDRIVPSLVNLVVDEMK
jgi:hypothetical protein